MLLKLLQRLSFEVNAKTLFLTGLNLCLKNAVNLLRFERRQRLQQQFFPGFVIVSLTTRCNLRCQGCWVTSSTALDMSLEMARHIVRDSIRKGSYYFGLVGGEPLTWPHLFTLIEEFPQAYFQVFTNGTLLTHEVARRMRRCGNVTPLISMEGLAEESDRRRNGSGVFNSALLALENCRRSRLLTGVACSVCRSNFGEMVNDDLIKQLIELGVHYLWYYIYRPVGTNPHPENALDKGQIKELRRFIVDSRIKHPIGIIDAYWDADGKAICPGAIGLSHHISPDGYIEFCPPLQFAFSQVSTKKSVGAAFAADRSLELLRRKIAARTRGCIILNDPALLQQWLEELDAIDSSGRNSAMNELKNMCAKPCHDLGDEAIPEKSRFYRIAKRFSFFGFSAYG